MLRPLYGCVRLSNGLQSVLVPCLGSKWEGNRPRSYKILECSASLNTTHPEWRSPAQHRQGKCPKPQEVTLTVEQLFVTQCNQTSMQGLGWTCVYFHILNGACITKMTVAFSSNTLTLKSRLIATLVWRHR